MSTNPAIAFLRPNAEPVVRHAQPIPVEITTTIPSSSTSTAAFQMPLFNTTYVGISSWEVFITVFEVTAKKLRWTAEQRCLTLVRALVRKAMAEIPSIPAEILESNDLPALQAKGGRAGKGCDGCLIGRVV